jgi:hypothetical protein
MKYSISPDRMRLTITVDETERAELHEMDSRRICGDAAMYDFLEPITCNSELEWICPEETGDLTNAPMLGIRDCMTDELRENGGAPPVIERWAWMDYQLLGLLEGLKDRGFVILTGGN